MKTKEELKTKLKNIQGVVDVLEEKESLSEYEKITLASLTGATLTMKWILDGEE